MSNTATQKQIDFMTTLADERRQVSERNQEQVEDALVAARKAWRDGTFDKALASATIDYLMSLPKSEAPADTDEPEAGVYRREDGQFYRVYFGQQSGRMLAKHIRFFEDRVDYMYAGAARLVVKGATRLTIEEVGSIGIATGECLMCGRRLDDPESVDRGIGPVCAAKY